MTTLAPTEAVTRRWTLGFTLVWLGIWMAWLVPVQLLLPDQLYDVDRVHRVRDFAVINGLVGVVSIVALPLFGALCDRTRSRWGRRRVWVALGTVVFAAGLVLTGLQTTWTGIAACWVMASLGYAMTSAGLTATIADRVPEAQRGMISGAMFGPQALGIVLGILAVGAIGPTVGRYGLLAVVLVVLTMPFLAAHRDRDTGDAEPLSLRAVVGSLWVDPRANPDFGWAFAGRLLVNLGNAFGTTYLLFFLRDALEVADPEGALLQLTLLYLVGTVAATLVAGWLSDRTGKRRVFVAIASATQAVAAILLAAFPSMDTALVAAGLLGLGYGAFLSVDQALVTAVLPDAADRAKDLGILNVGSSTPQALGPLLAGLVISSPGGYSALFYLAGVVTLVGAALVYRIRSVP